MDARQVRDTLIIPVCAALGLNSPSAVQLLLGTAAQESHMGHYLVQVRGPAIGMYQMEPNTYLDIWRRYIGNSP